MLHCKTIFAQTYTKKKTFQCTKCNAICKYSLSNNCADGIKCAGWKISKATFTFFDQKQ